MNRTFQYEDNELFKRIAHGDEKSFSELFHIYTPKLLPFITKLTRDENLAKEMIQEIFLRIWIKRNELETIEHPSAWIYKIASNLSLTFLKTQANRKRLLQQVKVINIEESASEVIESKDLNVFVQKAVSLLPEKRQQVYRLSREKGLSHNEIAETLNISVNTVKNHIGNSLKSIRNYIDKNTGLTILTIIIFLHLYQFSISFSS